MDRNYPNRFIVDATFMVRLRSFVIPFFNVNWTECVYTEIKNLLKRINIIEFVIWNDKEIVLQRITPERFSILLRGKFYFIFIYNAGTSKLQYITVDMNESFPYWSSIFKLVLISYL